MRRKRMTVEQALQQVAMRNHTTVEEVRKQIQIAMLYGLCNNDPAVKEKWNEIPHAGEVPTPEELISHLAEKVSKGIK